MISGGEGRGKHCSSHCRHWQAQRKVMSNHYFPGPFGMQISHNCSWPQRHRSQPLALPHMAFLLLHCGRYHTLTRGPVASMWAPLKCNRSSPFAEAPFWGLAVLAWVTFAKFMSLATDGAKLLPSVRSGAALSFCTRQLRVLQHTWRITPFLTQNN